jgi:hypothetical protein
MNALVPYIPRSTAPKIIDAEYVVIVNPWTEYLEPIKIYTLDTFA